MSRPIVVLTTASALLILMACTAPGSQTAAVSSSGGVAVSTAPTGPLEINVQVDVGNSTITVRPYNAAICAPPNAACRYHSTVNWKVTVLNPGNKCGADEDECTVEMKGKHSAWLNGSMYGDRTLVTGPNSASRPPVSYDNSKDERFVYSLRAFDKNASEIAFLDPDIMPHPPGG